MWYMWRYADTVSFVSHFSSTFPLSKNFSHVFFILNLNLNADALPFSFPFSPGRRRFTKSLRKKSPMAYSQ
jgi:hypothetical protein